MKPLTYIKNKNLLVIQFTKTIKRYNKKTETTKYYKKLKPLSTFEFRIDAHVRLFISEKKSYLCKLIRDCAFINFFRKN